MKKLTWLIANIEEIIAVIATTLMVAVVSVNVIMRYFFNNPMSWASETAVICLIWATFSGAAAAWKKNAHYGMDYLVDHIPEKARQFLRRAIMLLCIVLFIYLGYLSVVFTASVSKVTAFFRLSYRYLDAATVFGFASMAIHSIFYFVQSFTNPDRFEQRFASAYENIAPQADTNDAGQAKEATV